MKQYYAKSNQPNGRQPTNREHLESVAALAAQFGEDFDMGQAAKTAGLFHDFGKYTSYFQDILIGARHGGGHALGGAIMLYPKAQRCKPCRALSRMLQPNAVFATMLTLLTTTKMA